MMKQILLLLVGLLLAVPALGQTQRGFVDHVDNHTSYDCNAARAGHRIWCLADGQEETCDGAGGTWTATMGGLTSVFACTGPDCNDIDAQASSVLDFTADAGAGPTLDANADSIELRLPVSTDPWTALETTPKEGAVVSYEDGATASVFSELIFIGRDISDVTSPTPQAPFAPDAIVQDISGDIRGIWDCTDYNEHTGEGLGEMYDFEEFSTARCGTIRGPDQNYLDFSTSNPACGFYFTGGGSVAAVTDPGGGLSQVRTSTSHEIGDNRTSDPQRVLLKDMSVTAYNGWWTATKVDADEFTIPLAFAGNATGEAAWIEGDCQPAVVDEPTTGLVLPGLYGTNWDLYQWGHHCNNFSNPVLSGTDGVIDANPREAAGQVCYYWQDNDDTPTTVDTQGDEGWDRQLWVGNGLNADIDSVANVGGVAEFTMDVGATQDHRFLPGERVDITGTTADVYDGATLTVASVIGASDNQVQVADESGLVAYVSNQTGEMHLNPDRIGGVCQQILWSVEDPDEAGTIYLDLRDHAGSGTLNNEDQFLMAAAVMTASHLACTVDAAPGAGNSWDVTILSGIADSGIASTNVTCSISGASDTDCVDNDNIAVIPASTIVNPWAIAIEVVGTSSPNAATEIDCRMCLTAK